MKVLLQRCTFGGVFFLCGRLNCSSLCAIILCNKVASRFGVPQPVLRRAECPCVSGLSPIYAVSLPKRCSEDDRTIGELFLLMVDEPADTTFAQAMRLILDAKAAVYPVAVLSVRGSASGLYSTVL